MAAVPAKSARLACCGINMSSPVYPDPVIRTTHLLPVPYREKTILYHYNGVCGREDSQLINMSLYVIPVDFVEIAIVINKAVSLT